jgi:hypothetical protein
VNHAERVRPVECGANLNGVAQRLFGCQRALRESLRQQISAHQLVAGKTNVTLVCFNHDLSTRRMFRGQRLLALSTRFYYPLSGITMIGAKRGTGHSTGTAMVPSHPLRRVCNGISLAKVNGVFVRRPY